MGADHHARRYRRHASSSSRSCCGATTRSGAGCSSSCSSCSASAPPRTTSTRSFAYYDNVAQLAGLPTYPTVDGNASGPGRPAAAQRRRDADHRARHREQVRHLRRRRCGCRRSTSPTRGSTSRSSSAVTATRAADRLADRQPAARRPSSRPPRAATRSSSSCPTSSRTASPATASASTPRRRATRRPTSPRTSSRRSTTSSARSTNAKGRAIGGLSMGGFCALNLGFKHPDLYSAVTRPLRRDGLRSPTRCPGATRRSTVARTGRQKADANSPSKYVSTLDGSKGPAIYLGSGTGDPTIIAADAGAAPQAAGSRVHRGVPAAARAPTSHLLERRAQGLAALGGPEAQPASPDLAHGGNRRTRSGRR